MEQYLMQKIYFQNLFGIACKIIQFIIICPLKLKKILPVKIYQKIKSFFDEQTKQSDSIIQVLVFILYKLIKVCSMIIVILPLKNRTLIRQANRNFKISLQEKKFYKGKNNKTKVNFNESFHQQTDPISSPTFTKKIKSKQTIDQLYDKQNNQQEFLAKIRKKQSDSKSSVNINQEQFHLDVPADVQLDLASSYYSNKQEKSIKKSLPILIEQFNISHNQNTIIGKKKFSQYLQEFQNQYKNKQIDASLNSEENARKRSLTNINNDNNQQNSKSKSVKIFQSINITKDMKLPIQVLEVDTSLLDQNLSSVSHFKPKQEKKFSHLIQAYVSQLIQILQSTRKIRQGKSRFKYYRDISLIYDSITAQITITIIQTNKSFIRQLRELQVQEQTVVKIGFTDGQHTFVRFTSEAAMNQFMQQIQERELQFQGLK